MKTVAKITDTFNDGTILITGSTGFLGKILTDKLLRSCGLLKTIAVLVRNKRGLTAEQRIADMYNQVVFDRLRKRKPDFMNYIKVINGNIEEPSLGLSLTDRNWLIQNVNFVFHCAATVKFNEPLDLATKINVLGTTNILALAAEMKHLKGFVHVSTAYSHCPRNEIKEKYYPVPITSTELTDLLDIDALTSDILGDWPNTYTFTKAITENLISINEYDLPISIFRPSIIGCTKSEPYPGWFENMTGPPGIITGIMVGFLRAVLVDESKVFDLVPADYTVNALIGVMWETVNSYQRDDRTKKKPKIYNYVSGVESPLTWGKYIEEMHVHYHNAPPLRAIWYVFSINYTNLWTGQFLRFWLHRIPAVFVDLLLRVNGQKPKMMKMYSKTENLMDLYYTFSTKEWKFDNTNTKKLWLTMNPEERVLFKFNLEEFDWLSYIKCYYYGIRKYILHEDTDNISKALAKNRKLFWLHNFCIAVFIFVVLQICWVFLSRIILY